VGTILTFSVSFSERVLSSKRKQSGKLDTAGRKITKLSCKAISGIKNARNSLKNIAHDTMKAHKDIDSSFLSLKNLIKKRNKVTKTIRNKISSESIIPTENLPGAAMTITQVVAI